ncbi:hypothetical protein Bca101_067749 [Brassica carinata]
MEIEPDDLASDNVAEVDVRDKDIDAEDLERRMWKDHVRLKKIKERTKTGSQGNEAPKKISDQAQRRRCLELKTMPPRRRVVRNQVTSAACEGCYHADGAAGCSGGSSAGCQEPARVAAQEVARQMAAAQQGQVSRYRVVRRSSVLSAIIVDGWVISLGIAGTRQLRLLIPSWQLELATLVASMVISPGIARISSMRPSVRLSLHEYTQPEAMRELS